MPIENTDLCPMRKVQNDADMISGVVQPNGKTVIDIGCGTGDLVRWMSSQGGCAVGVDMPEMLNKALTVSPKENYRYIAGLAERLPFKKECADAVVYFASLHHVPKEKIKDALHECQRVLKIGGNAIIVEPVGEEGSYFEVVSLIEDEREIQAYVYSRLKSANKMGLRMLKEEYAFFERKFQDYQKLVDVFVDEPIQAKSALAEARQVFKRFAENAGIAFEEYSFRSICRINLLQKQR
jgi:ubiquinone/menaquinone biosynthesis C-methylase UbiE